MILKIIDKFDLNQHYFIWVPVFLTKFSLNSKKKKKCKPMIWLYMIMK